MSTATHEVVNGIRINYTHEESDSKESEWIDKSPRLPEYKTMAIAVNQTEAGVRIAELFNTTYGSNKLRDTQFNKLILYMELREKEIDGTITVSELNVISNLRRKKDNVKAIRFAENDAATLINAIASTDDLMADKAAVDAVTVSWPD